MKKALSFLVLMMFSFVLIACEDKAVDTTKPVINGVRNITHEIGDEAPDWLDGVSATDDVDENVEVTVDVSKVNLDVVGNYEVVYKAVDSAGNEATRTIIVTVSAKDTEPPVISGTKDFVLEQGATKPNWLQGVTVVDNVDSNPTLTVDDSAVKLDEIGEYDLIYNAVDSEGNESTVTVKVKVVEPVLEETVEFGEEPYNNTATTSVSGVGVALYFDATENDVLVTTEQVSFVIESAPSGATGANAAVISYLEAQDVYYIRAYIAGTYEISLVVRNEAGIDIKAETTHEIVVAPVSTDTMADKALVRAIYPDNIAANPDYRTNEGTMNEFLVIGKTFTTFIRHEPFAGTNFAAAFVGFGDFEGGAPLEDFTISFAYEAHTDNWKLLMSAFSGEEGADAWAGDWLRILTNRDQIGIEGDTKADSEFGDEGEATDIPLRTEIVHIKFTREIVGTTATLRLFTSLDGENYELQIETLFEDIETGAGTMGGKLTGFALFSIDNDFTIHNLEVSSEVFSVTE